MLQAGGSQAWPLVLLLGGASVIIGILGFLAAALMIGALVHGVSQYSIGQRVSIGQSYSFAWRRLGPLIGVYLIVCLAVGAASITIIGIPLAIYLAIIWAFIIPAVVLEGLGVGGALSRSRALVKDNWWRVFGILLVVFLLVFAAALVLSAPTTIAALFVGFGGAAGGASSILIDAILIVIGFFGGLMVMIAAPIFPIASILLYYDLRLKKEGYTLEMMASELAV